MNISDNIKEPIEFFHLFVDDVFYQKMIGETNLYHVISNEELKNNSRLNKLLKVIYKNI